MRVGAIMKCPDCGRRVRAVDGRMTHDLRFIPFVFADISGPREGCTHVCVLSEAAEREERLKSSS